MTLATASHVRNTRLPLITGRFVALAFVVSLVAAVVPFDAVWLRLLVVDAAIIVFWLIDWRRTVRPSKVDVERSVNPIVSMGATTDVEWTVTNPSKRALKLALADELAPSLRPRSRRTTAVLPAHGTVTLTTEISPERRGRFEISKMVVRVVGPWGLSGRQGKRTDTSTVRVYPPFDSRRDAELRVEKAQLFEAGLRSVRRHGSGTEFEQLREYRVDDDYRRIDWPATARVNKPIVRTYRAEQNQNVIILVDCGRVMAGRVGEITRLEHALDAVLAVSTVATRLGDRVGLVAFDDDIRSQVGLGHGSSHVANVTESIYRLQPRLVESNYRSAFVAAMSRSRRRSLIVLLTEPAAQAADQSLLPAMPLIARNHMVVVASVSDPDIATWARTVPTEADKAYRKAAASGALHDRRRMNAALRARGATVVDAEPGKLGAAVADAYMQAKASAKF